MSAFCIHEKTYPGSLYEPPLSWCEYGKECEKCGSRYSEEDFYWDKADYDYDNYEYDYGE